MPRRPLLAIALLAAILHGAGIFRSPLPAQDGLKFLRVARQFHQRPWADVVRGTDQHPLYPATIALIQPLLTRSGADSWRIAAQLVSALASVLTLIPIYLLARGLFDPATAAMAALLFVLLPLPAEVGHDTLSDPLALLAFSASMACGTSALRSPRLGPAIGCGIAAGLGYLARPEIAVAPLAVVLVGALQGLRGVSLQDRRALAIRMATLSIGFLAMVGSYAVVKGEVSEKLALRRGVAISSIHDAPAKSSRALPGLDDAKWDFAAKEEAESHPVGLTGALGMLGARWAEAMGLVLVPLALWGAWRNRSGAGLLFAYMAMFAAILIRHAMTFGYLSSRHTLSLLVVSLPFAAAAIMEAVRAVRAWRERRSPGSVARTTYLRVLAVAAILAIALAVQFHRPPHQSRWGHGEAGRWLAAHASPTEKVLDTRGWATFVSNRPGHDYWHVKQALNDPDLAYVVVGEDERSARSPRARTLRAVLAYAAEPVATFPDRRGGSAPGVRVYRFHPQTDWSGMTP
jgi:Dolichyl-phosphate-mannose-protein mannosyltransferase